jgi:hypothetical protein
MQLNFKKIALLLTVLLLANFFYGYATPTSAVAQSDGFADPAFGKVWQRTDRLIADGTLSRTWLWGPQPFSGAIYEDYADAPGGKRLVQYFDKSRMEINNPGGDKNSAFYVTNGLIARELITGRLQRGDRQFDDREPAKLGIAGDPDDSKGPTYAALSKVLGMDSNRSGSLITGSLDRDGNIGQSAVNQQVRFAHYEASTGQNIAAPFWEFLNTQGLVLNPDGKAGIARLFDPVFYATGLPITSAYWARVKVGGVEKDVLIQAFERRVLTFTPDNAPAYRVEMGNIGRHYFLWRYGDSPPTTPRLNLEFSGKDRVTTPNFRLNQGQVRFDIQYEGSSPFTLLLFDARGYIVEELVYSPASFKGERTVTIPTTGEYSLGVEFEPPGEWRITVFSP